MLGGIRDVLVQASLSSIVLLLGSVCLVTLCFTRVYTTVAYQCAVASEPRNGRVPSPLIPYTIPWFGSTLRFFEKHARRWYHRQKLRPPHGVYSMLIGGRRTHVITNSIATRHLFRHAYSEGLTRETFVKDILVKCLLVSPHDTSVINTGEGRKQQEEVFHKYLLRRESVTELTSTFSKTLSRSLEATCDQGETLRSINLYGWLRTVVLSSSLTTLFGEELVQLYPDICEDIFGFDEDLCMFFFGFSRLFNRPAWDRRRRLLDNLMKWDALIQRPEKEEVETLTTKPLTSSPDQPQDYHTTSEKMDPAGATSWNPISGSRFNRARHLLYGRFDLSMQSRAGMNLSIMFALASNVIPAIGWMLFHILAGPDSQLLLATVREEVKMATKPDGTLDISNLLSSSPLLQSLWTEVLRHYCDNMIMRDVVEDTTIPLDDQGFKWMKAAKGDMIISPCWIAHHDPAYWQDGDTFIADRFVGEHHAGAKLNAGVSTAKMYPFGGGKSICAGRIFAKEEAIVTVAQILLRFDFSVHGFRDAKGQPTSSFPGLTPSLPGVVVYVPEGDLCVTIRKRESRST